MRRNESAGAAESNFLRAATTVIGDRNISRERSRNRRSVGHHDRAIRARSEARAAIVGLSEISGVGSGDRNGGDAKGNVSLIAQRDFFRQALGPNRLIAEVERRR